MIPPIASRFVAGERPDAALEHARDLHEREVGAILNRLGEHYTEPGPAEDDATHYRELVEDVADASGPTCLSVKPSQIGLDVSTDLFEEQLARIVEHAADHDVFVWIDMEDSSTTDATLDAFETQAEAHPWSVGVCLQANLKRTTEDLERFVDTPGKLRLVKGAYDEPAEIAYTDKSRVNEAYEALLEQAFADFDRGIAVGSHDDAMVDLAIELADEHGTDFEIQMLMGVREDLQYELAADHEVWQYVPYGSKWLSYFYRRAIERKENLLFAARAVLGR